MELIIVFLVGLASGFLGATVGSGGMISIPALLFLGLPPQTVVGTNKIGDMGAFIAAVKEYLKAKKIEWRFAAILAVLASTGSVLGIQIMIRLDASFLKMLIGIVILVFLPFLFLKKDMGLKGKKAPQWKVLVGLSLYFAISVVSAITGGAGGATVSLFIMVYFIGFEIIKGYATSTPAELLMAAIPAIVYFFYGFIHVEFGIVLLVGSFVGGYVGSKTALKKGNRWVRNLFAVVVLISVMNILFF